MQKNTAIVKNFLSILEQEKQTLDNVVLNLRGESETILRACEVLLCRSGKHGCPRRVIVSGTGKAGLVANKVGATMTSTGTTATFIHPVEALHGDLGSVDSGDCGLLFSYSGETIELIRLARELQRLGCPLVIITRSRESTLGQLATICLETGTVHEAGYMGLAPTSSTTAMMAIGDALALTVAEARGFSEEDFGKNHPGGALGLRFRRVREFMRADARFVCVRPTRSLKETVALISEAKTGAAVLSSDEGTLLGIFTDGDLRRALLRGGLVLEQAVERFASVPCRFISAEGSVAEALKLFHETRVEELPVIDQEDKRVVGLLCLKDIATL